MIIVFLGPPGSGKGTQAAKLAARNELVHLSTGELLREACSSGTPLGTRAARYIDAGRLVPDELVADLVVERIHPGSFNYLLDGYPRNLPQATRLEQLAEATGHAVELVLLLDVQDDELIRRLAGRGRSDDDPDTIRQRLDVYRRETAPLISYYDTRGVLRRVNGMGGIDEIHKRVVLAMEQSDRA